MYKTANSPIYTSMKAARGLANDSRYPISPIRSSSRFGLLAAAVIALSGAAQAALIVEDNFNYSGALTSNGWAAISGGGTAVINTGTGLDYTALPSSGVGNSAVINPPITSGATGEDLRKAFSTGITSGTLYTSFLINLTSATSGGDYFFATHGSAASGGGFNGRIFAKTSGSGYVLGLTKSSVIAYDTTVRNFNTTYLVVLKVKISSTTTTDDTVSIWVNPALASSESTALLTSNSGNDITAATGFDGVVIRQGSGTPAGKIDSILVGTTWADVTPFSTPTLSTSVSSLTGFSTTEGTASTAQTFTLTGVNLTANLTVAAPSGFEVATDGTNYGSSKTITPSPNSVNATISVRLATNATAGAQSGNVTVTSANSEVSVKNVAVSGTVTAANLPAISLTPTAASGLANYLGYPSAPTLYTVTGTNLGTTNLTVTPSSSSLEVSTNATTDFTNSLTFTPIGGVVSNTVYVRVSAVAPAGAVNASVGNVSGPASNNFTVTGTVTTPPLTLTTTSVSIYEGDGSQQGTVSIPADLVLPTDLTVTVASSSGTDLQVDGGAGLGAITTVTIPAFSTSALFYLNAPADNIIDLDSTVTLTATATGFAGGTRVVTVKNVDVAKASLAAVNTPYTQNFDSLGTGSITNAIPTTIGIQAVLGTVVGTNLNGWFATKLSGSSAAGSFTAITADAGAGTSGLIYSYGASGNTDRGLGLLASGSNLMGIGAVFQNDTGSTINSVSISFAAEFWRTAGSAKNKLTFGYGKLGGSVTGVNFLTATGASSWLPANVDGPDVVNPQLALDGNLAANRRVISTSFNITLAPGEAMYIRWLDADETGSDGGAAVDDFSITASTSSAVLSAPTLADVSVDALSLSQTQATVLGNVTSDGGVGVDSVGFVYATASVNADPVLGGVSVSSVTNTPAVGAFTNSLTGLTAGTSYAVKAYAINSQGTNYSPVATVTTLASNPVFTGVYTQNFSGVTNPSLIPAGWRALSSSNQNNFVGSWTNTNATTGGFYSRTETPGILGYLHTGSTGVLTNKLTLVNGTGGVLTNLYVSYTGEVNLTANTRIPAFTVAVNGTDVPALAFSTGAGTNAVVATQLTGLNIADGSTLVITWSCDRGTGTGSSRMIGLTDVRVGTTAPGPTAPSNLSYSPSVINGFVGQAISSLTPTVTGTVDTYSVSPSLPAGLSINPTSGVISGTPLVTASSTYTVTAVNAGGATTTGLTLQVSKGTPIIIVPPTAPALTVGATLSTSTLAGGSASVPGTFAWTDGTIVPSATGSYGVTFTPTDTANYDTATTTVSVTVNPAGTTFTGWSGGATLNSANLAKYAIGGASSLSAADGVRPTSTVSGGDLVLTAIVRTDDAKLSVVGEAVTVLTDYATPASIVSVNGVDAADQTGVPAGCKRRTFTVSQGADAKKFLRLNATLAP